LALTAFLFTIFAKIQHLNPKKGTMSSCVKKVFFFPDMPMAELHVPLGPVRGTLNYVGVLGAERTTTPYFHIGLDAELATRFIRSLSSPESEYVVVLRHDHPPKDIVKYLHQQQIDFATKKEIVTYPSSVIYLAALGVKVHSPKYYVIYRTTQVDEVRWAIAKYGSLDRVRVFVTHAQSAPHLAAMLAQPAAQIDYNVLLDLSKYHTLFDYDWEYFYIVTRKPHIDHIISWLRRACHALEVETETLRDMKMIVNLRGRLERLLGISLFQPVALNPTTA
jgi:hypothetical protein